MFLVFNLLFQQSSSRALQTFPSICTARPTISTLKSRKTVFPHCLHEIQKKTFSDSENWKQPAKWHSLLGGKRSAVFYSQELGYLVPKWHFHQAPAMLQPGSSRGRCTAGSHSSATTWVLNLGNPPRGKASQEDTAVHIMLPPWS